jgi:lysophospholipase L1-like esterase
MTMPKLSYRPITLLYKLVGAFIVKQQEMRASQFAILPRIQADVVFLGDSITEFGLWDEWIPDLSVVNRGVAGDTSEGVLKRLDSAVGNQRFISILIGSNDIVLGLDQDKIAGNIETIISEIGARSPTTKILLNSVMPRTRSFRSTIVNLNKRLQAITNSSGVTFIDLWPALSDSSGELRPEFSLDRTHLTGAGYEVWVRILREHLNG